MYQQQCRNSTNLNRNLYQIWCWYILILASKCLSAICNQYLNVYSNFSMRFCSLIACRLRYDSLKILKLFKEICCKFAFYYVISWNQIQKRINFAKDFKLCYLLDIDGHCHRWCTVVYSGILCRCCQRDTGLA